MLDRFSCSLLHPVALMLRRGKRAAAGVAFGITVGVAFGMTALGLLCLSTLPVCAAPPLGVNGDAEFVNLVNGFGGWGVAEDANGWPLADCQAVPIDARHNMPWNAPDPGAINDDVSGVYHVSFNGQAAVSGFTESGSVGVQNQSYNATSNLTTLDLVQPPNQWLMVLTFTNTRRTASSGVNTGFTHLKIVRPGYPLSTTQLFTTASLNGYGPGFNAIRTLGVDGANNYQNFSGSSLIPVQWADRPKVSDAYQGGTNAENDNTAPGHAGHGWAWEYIVQLANQTRHDLWINVPVGATDDYVTKLAELLKYGSDGLNPYTAPQSHPIYPPLDPSLHVYVEYSNEVWNFGFPQYVWNALAAENEVAAGRSDLNNDNINDKPTWHFRRYARRLKEISDLFKNVYGGGAIDAVIRPVFLWQYDTEFQPLQGDSVWGPSTLSVLQWFETTYGAPKNWFYGIGEAPYYGPSDTSTVNNLFATLWTGSDQTRSRFIAWQALAAFYGLKQVGYESGPSLVAYNGGPATRDARMTASEVHHFLDNWFAVGGDEVNFFALRGSVSEFGDWLAVEDYDHLHTPKMDGILKILASPTPALTAGSLLPTAVGSPVLIEASQWEQSGVTPGNRETVAPPAPHLYLLRAAYSGAYTLTLNGRQDNAALQEQISVDDHPVGTVQMPVGADGDSAAVSFDLEPGLHTLQVNYLSAVGGHAVPNTLAIALTSGGGPDVAPSAPANPTLVSVGDGSVNLVWAIDAGATGYTIYRSNHSGSGFVSIGSSSTPSFTDVGLTNGKTYYYEIVGENSVGESAHSPQVPATPTLPVKPAPPTGLKLLLAANGTISFLWRGAAGADYYNIYRSTTSGGGYSRLGSQIASTVLDGGGGPFYSDPSDGTTYYYVVTAVNTFGESAFSTQLAATPTDQILAAPTGLHAVASNGRVALNWTPPPGARAAFSPMQYTVSRAATSGGPYTPVVQTSTANAVDEGLTNGVSYFYVVTANNSKGASANSIEVSSTPSGAGVISINAGGAAEGGFAADTGYGGGSAISTAASIDVGALENTAPQAVFQTARVGKNGKLTYNMTGLQPGGGYTLLLHFAEIDPSVTAPGQRVFSLKVNGGQVLTDFDILQRSGAADRAIDQKIPVKADNSGRVQISFLSTVGNPLINGIEIR